jgi:hypothetical protein
LVAAATDLIPAIAEPVGSLGEGPRWKVAWPAPAPSPGRIGVYERQLRHHQADVDIRAACGVEREDMAEGMPT